MSVVYKETVAEFENDEIKVFISPNEFHIYPQEDELCMANLINIVIENKVNVDIDGKIRIKLPNGIRCDYNDDEYIGFDMVDEFKLIAKGRKNYSGHIFSHNFNNIESRGKVIKIGVEIDYGITFMDIDLVGVIDFNIL